MNPPDPRPLPVEMLVSDDHRRLSVATSASKPIPAPRPRRDPIDELVGYLRTIKPEDCKHR